VPELTTVSRTFENTTNDYYNRIALVAYEVGPNATYGDVLNFAEMELFGVPEYDPEAHGTDVIMRSVPNVPNTDWLEVYWDAKNYSGSGDVQDETSNNRDGTVNCGFDNGDVKAFTFSGAYTSNVTTSDHGLGTGDVTYTVSYWFKRTAVASSYDYLFLMGPGGLNRQNILMYIHVDELRLDHWGAQLTVPEPITLNKWYHVVAGHRGGNTPDLNNDFIYIDGKKIYVTASGSGAAFNLASGKLTLGSSHYTTTEFFNGSIANFRVFNRALTGDEIWQLYAYQKDYFQVSPDVVTFKGGRLGIGTEEPRAVLDVRGSAVIDRTYTLVDNIVAQYIVPSNSEFVHIPNLDLDGDGGTYKIVISLKNATTNNPNMSMYINDVSTSASYYSKRTQHTSGSSLSNTNGEYIFGLGNSSEHHHEFTLSRHAISGYPICTGTGMFHTGTTKSSGAVQGWDLHAWVYYGNVNVTKLSFQTYPHNAIATGSIFTIYKYL
tara:strand:- start:305 stop:1777 length:1473 start_codon:yes stop_codon:yes gene_type:complete